MGKQNPSKPGNADDHESWQEGANIGPRTDSQAEQLRQALGSILGAADYQEGAELPGGSIVYVMGGASDVPQGEYIVGKVGNPPVTVLLHSNSKECYPVPLPEYLLKAGETFTLQSGVEGSLHLVGKRLVFESTLGAVQQVTPDLARQLFEARRSVQEPTRLASAPDTKKWDPVDGEFVLYAGKTYQCFVVGTGIGIEPVEGGQARFVVREALRQRLPRKGDIVRLGTKEYTFDDTRLVNRETGAEIPLASIKADKLVVVEPVEKIRPKQ